MRPGMFLVSLCGGLTLGAFAAAFLGKWIPDSIVLKMALWSALAMAGLLGWSLATLAARPGDRGIFSLQKWIRLASLCVAFASAFFLFQEGYRDRQKDLENYFIEAGKPTTFRVIDIPGFQGRLFHFEALVEDGGSRHSAAAYRVHVESKQKLPNLKVGDAVRIRGEIVPILKTDPGSYRSYLIEKDVAYKVRLRKSGDLEVLTNAEPARMTAGSLLSADSVPLRKSYYRLMEYLREKFDRYVGAPAASLSYGLVTGIKSTLPSEVREDFRMTGTYHILAVSGSHAVILSAIFYSLLRFLNFSRRWASFVLLFIIFPPYLFVTDFQVSIIRTWLMLILAFGVALTGREVRPIRILAFVFACVVLVEPNQIFSISFQLSFAAVLGMLLFVEFIRVRDIKNNVLRYVLISLGAQLMTAPVLIYFFGYLNFFSFVYNALIEFLIPISLLYSLVLAISPFHWLSLVLGKALWMVNETTFQIIHWTRKDFSFFSVGLQGNLWLATLLFSGFAAGLFLLGRWKKKEVPVEGSVHGRN